MKENVIKVLKVAPHEVPEVIYLENKLEVLQAAVSIGTSYRGLIEIVPLDDDANIICNEDGKLIGLEPNRRLGRDVLCGVFYITGENEEGDLASLSEELIQRYSARFAVPENIPMEEAENALVFEFIFD